MIETARLILRPWRDSDLPLFAEQNADPVVMRYLVDPLTRAQSAAYAAQAARATIEDGFTRVGLSEIVALTALGNMASQRVMERLGMTRTIEFDHPAVTEDSPLRRHVLYRQARA